MKRVFMVIMWVLALSLLSVGVVAAQAGEQTEPTGEIAILLAPLIAAATAIERLVEMIFDRYESIVLNISKFPDQVTDYVSWARKEVEKYQEQLFKNRDDPLKLATAEDKLEAAKERLQEYLHSPQYTSRKKTIALVVGVVLGVLIAVATELRMFLLLGIDVRSSWIDMIVTGLVIGTGSQPVHSLIGILQKGKDAVDQARALWGGKAYSTTLNAEVASMAEERKRMELRLREIEQRIERAEGGAVDFGVRMDEEEEEVRAVPTREALEQVEQQMQQMLSMETRNVRRRVKGILR